MTKALELEVRRRAGFRCEYCHVPEARFDFKHEIDHIIAQKHHGPTILSNLALCCGDCNMHKGPNVAGVDPETGQVVRLFNPREDRWDDHFRWDGAVLMGITAIGRATIDVLAINLPVRILARRALAEEAHFDQQS
ncbi:MAG TPA: HNH endonuclease signature motif containing protein [Tepidisphaeraceae bacterium]|jgi:hypothetical protein